MKKGFVRALFIAPEKKARPLAVSAVSAVAGGFDGDYHSHSRNRRQILMVSAAVLDQFELEPGAIRENVVVDGLDVMSLSEGEQIRMGKALLEVTSPCEPCSQMDRVRPGLKGALRDRRGMFAQVIQPGEIRIGDSVEPCPAE